MDNELKNHFFKTMQSERVRCHFPDSCDKRAIQAHSVQNSKILDVLCVANHVIMPSKEVKDSEPIITWKKVGRNKATTFYGLCSEHDTLIFSPIETVDIDISSMEHCFLLSYRAVLRQYHTSMKVASNEMKMYNKGVELKLSDPNVVDSAMMFATEKILASYQIYRFKHYYDTCYMNRYYDRINHTILRLKETNPVVAASSMFSTGTLYYPWNTCSYITFTIFPYASDTIVVFSYMNDQESQARVVFDQLALSQGEFRNYLVSKLLVSRCENFVLSPRIYDRMDESRRSKIIQFFTQTMFDDPLFDDPLFDDPSLNLFI